MKLVAIFVLSILVVVIQGTQTSQHHQKTGQVAGGHDAGGKKHEQHKHVEESAKKSAHEVEKAAKGQSLKESHKKDKEEKGGKKTVHHESGGHKAVKSAGGASAHGAKFEEGAKKKKLSYKKGFREKYHKDEHKKHDSFYSNGHKSGDFHVFGEKKSKHKSLKGLKKHLDTHKSGKNDDDYRKMWLKLGGHNYADKKGHKSEKTAKSHHNKQEKWAKKGGKKGGKQYKYKAPPHKK